MRCPACGEHDHQTGAGVMIKGGASKLGDIYCTVCPYKASTRGEYDRDMEAYDERRTAEAEAEAVGERMVRDPNTVGGFALVRNNQPTVPLYDARYGFLLREVADTWAEYHKAHEHYLNCEHWCDADDPRVAEAKEAMEKADALFSGADDELSKYRREAFTLREETSDVQ